MKNHLRKKLNVFWQKIFNFCSESLQSRPYSLYSEHLGREVKLKTLTSKRAFSTPKLSLLLVNDGQDFAALQIEKTLQNLHTQKALDNLLIVGIDAGDRMQEYGTAQQADYAQRGARAKQYTQFVLQELLPFLHQHFSIKASAEHHAFAGFSLGALSALDIVWNNPTAFQMVGVFSGALWWRSTPFDPQNPDADRIMHQQISEGQKQKGLRFWLQTGTHDETADRNNNGIIDAIDDTLDLIAVLEQKGYKNGQDITYLEVDKGEHNPPTWGAVFPDFLIWCFGKN